MIAELTAVRVQVDGFEAELMEKVSKQQRSKMNRVQVKRPAPPRHPEALAPPVILLPLWTFALASRLPHSSSCALVLTHPG